MERVLAALESMGPDGWRSVAEAYLPERGSQLASWIRGRHVHKLTHRVLLAVRDAGREDEFFAFRDRVNDIFFRHGVDELRAYEAARLLGGSVAMHGGASVDGECARLFAGAPAVLRAIPKVA